MTGDFFDALKPWSERKHRLLTKYLPPFSAKVASTTRRREIFIVDGFAGAAVFGDGRPGSPVLIARISDVCTTWRTPVTLKLINVEPDRKNAGSFESLEKETSEWVRKGIVRNIRSEFAAALPKILHLIGDAPALFFIDPFGPTGLPFQDLLPVLQRSKGITEIILNFDHDGLRRIVDAARSPKTDPKTAETNRSIISRVLGSDRWKNQLLEGSLTTHEAEQTLIREYMNNIAKFDFSVVAYPIRESLNATPKYQFVYCTRHPDGLELMNDFMREEEDLLYGDHITGTFPLFAEEASLENATAERRAVLRPKVLEFMRTIKIATRKQVIRALLINNFGQFTLKDYKAVVQDLLAEGRIKARSGKRRINDDELLEFNSEFQEL